MIGEERDLAWASQMILCPQKEGVQSVRKLNTIYTELNKMNNNDLIKNIRREADKLTDNEMLKDALVQFTTERVLEAQRKTLDSMKKLVPVPKQVLITIENFLIDELEITAKDLRAKSRKPEYIYPRHYLYYLSDYFLNTKKRQSEFSVFLAKKGYNNQTHNSITGQHLGFLHATVINSVTAVNNLIATDKAIREEILELRDKLSIMLKACYC